MWETTAPFKAIGWVATVTGLALLFAENWRLALGVVAFVGGTSLLDQLKGT